MPSYREADVAYRSVEVLGRTLSACFDDRWEVLVVDDGGGDFPPDAWAADERIKLLPMQENRGKGAAVRTGILAATGQARIFTDADLPYHVDLIPVMASYLLEGRYHLVAGDRNLPQSDYPGSPSLARRTLSGVATFFIGTLVTGGFFDTQCGIKGIQGRVAELLFPMLTIDRFAFDIELVYLCLRFNCDVKRLPVRLVEDGTPSTVRPIVDSARSLRDILRIKRNALRGKYSSPALDELVWADYEARLAEQIARPSG
ncbi:MAG: glycosyltransferase, partial [Gemmatimonadetes bacterium]|nr:glycosyltransferase [Gemmatimonadota bacterium]